ncbi:PREDICTED: probable G-protein coupled receptor 142, partial [Eurypyga helias]|uniref:probable G-protein coupled receptor 142 n=1 Tax=Eurypyga helias TaxID=54383 RepID=UPI0005291D8E
NVLTAVALSRLATRTKKSSYWYLLALTTSDILTQVFIIFVGFILQTAILARAVPSAFIHTVNVLEFTANHASIWVTVLLTADRYVALCHPLRYRATIICKLKRKRCSGGSRPRLSKTTALLLAVTTVFIVLWAPRTIVMIWHLYVASVKRDWRVHLALDIANMVAMLNTTLNFFLYCFVSQTFRRT